MSYYKDKVLGADEMSDGFLLVGNSDVIIQGLTSGSVTLQYLLKPTDELPSPQWTNFPDGTYTSDAYQTIFISEHGTKFRLKGEGNNAGVYVRLASFYKD